jgi:hypothetical protein
MAGAGRTSMNVSGMNLVTSGNGSYRVVLHVRGVELSDDAVLDSIATAEALADLEWVSIDGRTLVTVYCAEHDAHGSVVQTSRTICHLFPSAVIELDLELVGVTDIANRVDVTREAVRLWVKGARGPGDFPECVGSIGGGERGSRQIWPWSEVNEWLERNLGLGDGYRYLDSKGWVKLQSALLKLEDYVDKRWSEMEGANQLVAIGVQSELAPPLPDLPAFEWAFDVSSDIEILRDGA